MERDHDGVMAVDRIEGAVGRLLLLGSEGPEQAVPDDQDAAEVAVEILVVAGVVHPMVRGRVEHPLERPESTDELGMDEELVAEADAVRRDDPQGVKPEQWQRQPERDAGERCGPRSAKRRAEVEAPARVMGLVRGPQQRNGVARPVKPVVAEVLRDDEQDPHPRRVRQLEQPKLVQRKRGRDGRGATGDAREQRPEAHRDAREGITPVVGGPPQDAAHDGLEHDEPQGGDD